MTNSTRAAIIRDRRQGYKLWRIARDRGVTPEEALWVLVEANVVHFGMSDIVMAISVGAEGSFSLGRLMTISFS